MSFTYDISIFNRSNLSLIVNRNAPPFTPDHLLDTLDLLFRAGDLKAWRWRKRKRRRPFIPTRQELEIAFAGAFELSFGLTPQGGARWEAMAQFDWKYYIRGSNDDVEGLNPETIAVLLHDAAKSPNPLLRPIVLRPWKATYWKTFPEALCFRECERTGPSVPDCLWLNDWYKKCHAELRTYIPPSPPTHQPNPQEPWRKKLQAVSRLPTHKLLHLLNDRDTAIQYVAAMRLTDQPTPSTTATLIDWFIERRSQAALRVVLRLKHPKVPKACLKVLKTKVRFRSIDEYFDCLTSAMATTDDLRLALLKPMLLDGSESLALDTIRALYAKGAGPKVFNWLVKRTEPKALHLTRTLISLHAEASRPARPRYHPPQVPESQLQDPDPLLRHKAIASICQNSENFPTEKVLPLLTDPAEEVRANAVYALHLRGPKECLSAIEPLTRDPSPLVRYCAKHALTAAASYSPPR